MTISSINFFIWVEFFEIFILYMFVINFDVYAFIRPIIAKKSIFSYNFVPSIYMVFFVLLDSYLLYIVDKCKRTSRMSFDKLRTPNEII